MILLTDVIIAQVEVSLFGYLYTGMAEDLTEGENIHAVHQTSLGEVVSQTVGAVVFVQSSTVDVLLEVAFKVTDADGTAVFFDREEIVAFHIPVLKLKPSPENGFCFRGEVNGSVFAAFGFFGSEIDPLPGKLQICNQ